MQDFLNLLKDMPQYQKKVLGKIYKIYEETDTMPIIQCGRWAGKNTLEQYIKEVERIKCKKYLK